MEPGWKEAAHRWEAPPEPPDEATPMTEEYVLDHFRGMYTWGLWTKDKRTLLKQATLGEVMAFLERME